MCDWGIIIYSLGSSLVSERQTGCHKERPLVLKRNTWLLKLYNFVSDSIQMGNDMDKIQKIRSRKKERKDPYLLVVAIDFGTSYSGYAYSSRDNFLTDASKVFTIQPCNSVGKNLMSFKTPTCLLVNENKEFVAFGSDAESEYANVCASNDQSKYYYFQRFKMKLYQGFLMEDFMRPILNLMEFLFAHLLGLHHPSNDSSHRPIISPAMTAFDIGGKMMPAVDVFSLSIEALVNDFMARKEKSGLEFIGFPDIKWVLTVPAIWGERARNFMRKCAVKAGIPDENLSIALEPECASVFCQSLRPEQIMGGSNGFKASENGCKYMVVDIGGGTVDIAVHEKLEGQKLKELCRATGGDCGGTSVDTEFLNVMKKVFGDAIATEFRTSEPESFLDLLRSFESIKRTIKTDSKGTINVQIPYVTLSDFCKLNYKKDIEAHVNSSELKSSISVYKGHFRIETKFIRDLFEQTLTNLETLISNTFKQDRVKDVNTIVLVGGFAECALVQDRVKSAFLNKRVIIPEECGLAVLKGAVMFGHNTSFIALRVLPFTIGIQVCKPYNQTLDHDREHVFLLKGKEYSRNLFHIIVKRDAEVEVDTEIVKEFSTAKPYQEVIKVNIYSTKGNDITYVDDHECHFLGRSIIKVAKPSEKLQNVKVVFTFGNTEMSVSAFDPGNDDKYEGQLDLLTENDDDETPDIILDE